MQSVKRCSNLSMGRVPAAGSGLQLPPQTSVAKAAEKGPCRSAPEAGRPARHQERLVGGEA